MKLKNKLLNEQALSMVAENIIEKGITTIYPGHGAKFPVTQIK